MLMAPWTATRPDWWPRAILSVLALITRRPSLPLSDTPPFALSLLWLPWRTWNFALWTFPMPTSMAHLKRRSTWQQPEGFEVGGPDHVCRLRKSFYGLKQAGRVWNQTLYSVLSSMGFKHVESDHGLYIFLRDDVRILMPVFIDDITLACKDGAKIDSFVKELSSPSTSNCEIWGPPHNSWA